MMFCRRIVPTFLLGMLTLTSAMANAQGVDVAAHVSVTETAGTNRATHPVSPSVVLWLTSEDRQSVLAPASTVRYRMIQKNKRFVPKLLVVPLGSTVEFPNLDPFFHNVFSQFNGKRFDLGLYEAGSTKGIRFDHEGVSYIFCNIHPEMAAVIVTLSTPYFAISSGSGKVVIHQVPPGNYELHVWAEGADAKSLDALTRRVSVGPSQDTLGVIPIATSGANAPHKNKFGEDYQPDPTPY